MVTKTVLDYISDCTLSLITILLPFPVPKQES